MEYHDGTYVLTNPISEKNIKEMRENMDDNDIVEFTFKITNNRDNSITLNPDNNFKIYNSTNAQIPNIYSNDSNIIKSKDTMNYTLQYNIKNRELYEILFYSGIVENNIKFTVTNNDIK